MDLANLYTKRLADEGVKMELLHPETREPLTFKPEGEDKERPMTITLRGADSDAYRQKQLKISNQRIKRSMSAGSRNAHVAIDAEDLDKDALELLIASTVAWDGITINGELVEFSIDNVRQLYTEYPWIREQVDSFISDRSRFLPSS
jgi:hypothetical protein